MRKNKENTKYSRYLFIVLWCLQLFSCRDNHKDVAIEIIDLKKFKREELKDTLPQFYNEKKYIVLSADTLSHRLKNITKIIVAKNKIYAGDSYDKKIIVYDMNGNALAKVGDKGRASGEYINVTDFDVDDQDQLHMIDGRTDRLFVFDSRFKHKKTMKLPFEADIIKCMPENKYLFGLSSWNTSHSHGKKIAYTDADLNLLNTVGTYDNVDNNVWVSDYFFTSTQDGILYHRPVDDHVCLLNSKGEIKKSYYFDFGNKSIPENSRSDLQPLFDSEKISNYQMLLSFPVVQGNYSYGTLYDQGTTRTFIIDLNNKVMYTEDTEKPYLMGTIVGMNKYHLITCFPHAAMEIFPPGFNKNEISNIDDIDHLICIYNLNIP